MAAKNLYKFYNVLGNKVRYKIVIYLVAGEKCVCNIFRKLGLPQNLISHHLGILKKNGFITDRKNGKWVYYSLNIKKIKELKSSLDNILNHKKD